MKPNFDFFKTNELPYTKRDRFGAGDHYGIGEGAKYGKTKSSFMSIKPPKEIKNPVMTKED